MYYAAKTSLGVQHNPIVRDLRWQLRLFCADYCATPPGERHFVLRPLCFAKFLAFLGLNHKSVAHPSRFRTQNVSFR